MKRIFVGVLLALTALQSHAEGGFNGSLLFATDSIWRGVSQTGGRPYVEGDFYYETKSGLLFGQTFGDVNYGIDDPAFLESSSYVSYSHSLNDNFSIELTASRYSYPRAHLYDYNEAHAAATYKDVTLTAEYTNNYFNGHYEASYGEVAWNHDFKKDISIGGSFGYLSKNDDEGSYWNVRAYVNKRWHDMKYEASVSETPKRPHTYDNGGGLRFVLSVSRDFS